MHRDVCQTRSKKTFSRDAWVVEEIFSRMMKMKLVENRRNFQPFYDLQIFIRANMFYEHRQTQVNKPDQKLKEC